MNHKQWHSVFFTLVIAVAQSSSIHKPITIMTAPVGKTSWGHRQVTESLLRGLVQLHVPFVYNPKSFDQVTDTVVALADPTTVQQAIELKKTGRIKYLFAGPNIMTRADEHGGILASPQVDICIVPSTWVATAYEEEVPALKGRIRCWYAGVDPLYWQPTKTHSSKNVLIYWKTESPEFVTAVESVVQEHGFNPIRLQYGYYTAEQYKAVLSDVECAIFISCSESQGIALAEAWSINVPTLVWDPQELQAHGRVYSVVSACPYLTESTGCRWKTLSELKNLLSDMTNRSFAPRQWVMDWMTDTVSATMLLQLIDEVIHQAR